MFSKQKGFTITELVVVISIMVIMSAIFVANFRKGESVNRLQGSAQVIAQSIRKAQNMALSSTEVRDTIYDYYGVYFNESSMPNSFYIFASSNKDYKSGDEVGPAVELEDGVIIDSLSTGTKLNIIFKPPYSFVEFNPSTNLATIIIRKENGTCPQDCRCVRINNKGWMSIKTGAECEEELPGICPAGAGSDDSACGIIDCSGWYVQTGTESATETEYCYNKQDITSNRCEDVGDCKDPNSEDCNGQSNDALQYSCGICKYVSASNCTGTTLGSCSNYPAGTSCGSGLECDGNGNCVSACVPNIGDPCGGTACVNPGTIQCDGSCAGTSNKPVGTDCGVCKICDGNGNCSNTPADDSDCGIISCDDWHHIVGSANPEGTNYCYDSPDITSNRCEGFGDCKDANTADCGSADDTLELSCGTCKYVAGCSGTTDGYCANYADGTSCSSCFTCQSGSCITPTTTTTVGPCTCRQPYLFYCSDCTSPCSYSYASYNIKVTAWSSCTGGWTWETDCPSLEHSIEWQSQCFQCTYECYDCPVEQSTTVYVTTTTTKGNIGGGGRSGVDTFCSNNKPAAVSCSGNIHALISVSLTDEIRDMPGNYGYPSDAPLKWAHSSTGALTQFASSWDSVLGGVIDVCALTGTGVNGHVWTGSKNTGEWYSYLVCKEYGIPWACGDSSCSARYGQTFEPAFRWIDSGDNSGCHVLKYLMCACDP